MHVGQTGYEDICKALVRDLSQKTHPNPTLEERRLHLYFYQHVENNEKATRKRSRIEEQEEAFEEQDRKRRRLETAREARECLPLLGKLLDTEAQKKGVEIGFAASAQQSSSERGEVCAELYAGSFLQAVVEADVAKQSADYFRSKAELDEVHRMQEFLQTSILK